MKSAVTSAVVTLLLCMFVFVIGALAADHDGIVYSTHLTGVTLQGIAVDRHGNVYVTGAGADSSSRLFVAKLNPAGRVVYSRHIGGTQNENSGIAVDWQGNVYVTGSTSGGLATTPNAFRPSLNNSCIFGVTSDAFVVKLDGNGRVGYATYLGGCSVAGTNIAVDLLGNAYVTGLVSAGFASPGLPTTPGALNSTGCGEFCGFVAKLDPTGGSLLYGTYFGAFDVEVTDIAVNLFGEAYVTGSALPPGGVPTTLNAFEPDWPALGSQCPGFGPFAFVAKLNTKGTALIYGTYLGSGGGSLADNDCNASSASGVAVDLEGNAYVAGSTQASFPTTPNSVQPTYGGGSSNGFLTKLNHDGTSLAYSTYIGSGSVAAGVGVDLLNHADVVWGSSSIADARVAKVNASGTALANLDIASAQNADNVKIAVDYFGNVYLATFDGLVTKIAAK